jgi:hypothetical protein
LLAEWPTALGVGLTALDARPASLDAQHLALDARPASLDAQHLAMDARTAPLDAKQLTLDARPPALDVVLFISQNQYGSNQRYVYIRFPCRFYWRSGSAYPCRERRIHNLLRALANLGRPSFEHTLSSSPP